AGHGPPLLLSRDQRKAEEVGSRGPWLGLLPGEEYATTELSLEPGDRLVLYSTGVVEAASPDGKLFSPLRLRRLLLDEGSFSAEVWADRVLARLTAWIGKGDLRLDDDLTLVVLDIPD
ncbi:MAG: serine/threonine-protein phosphatase, partial [Chloroflexi bacterium]|nr:serine/threonine-protein phosphatase [Chloroflexota bacterium]